MESIVLPEKVVVRLVDSVGNTLRFADVLLTVKAFAKRKNDFHLGPFVTNEDGVATISSSDLIADARTHYDTGLMDYDKIENCKPDVLIDAMTQEMVEKALQSRTKIWTALLSGEAERWQSIDNLRNVYRRAANSRVLAQPLFARWDGAASVYEYSLVAAIR